MTDETPDDKDPIRGRGPRTPSSSDLRRISASVASINARPELLAAVRSLTMPDERFTAAVKALKQAYMPGSEFAASIAAARAIHASIGKLRPSVDLRAAAALAASSRSLDASSAALARALREQSSSARIAASSMASTLRAQQEQRKSLTGILDRYRANQEAISKAAAGALMGTLAATLVAGTVGAGLGRSLSETAAVLASARVVVDDPALWNGVRGLSALVDGISAVAGAEAGGAQPTEELVSALEREAERAGTMVDRSTTAATTLFSIDYINLVVALVALAVSMLGLANDYAQPDHGPAVVERLDRILEGLGKNARRASEELRTVDIVVSKRTANIRRGPTTRSAVVGRFAPGDKATIVGTTEAWLEIEFVDPLTDVVTRGWVYGKLVERVRLP